MVPRRDALFFSLALGLSLALHTGFLLLVPGMPAETPRPTQDVVVVDLASSPATPPVSPRAPQPPAEPAAAPEEEQSVAKGAPRPPDVPPPTDRKAPPAAEPPPPTAPTPVPSAPITTPAQAPASAGSPGASSAPLRGLDRPSATAVTAVPKATSVGPAAGSKPGRPSLQALLPTRRDLSAFSGPSRLPAPDSGEAQEVTLGVGEQDPRYRGYYEQVKVAVESKWHVGKSLIIAGGTRSVLALLTIDSMGLVKDVRIVQGCGNATLDAEAVDAVRRARIPPFPAEWTIQRINLMAQFDYLFR